MNNHTDQTEAGEENPENSQSLLVSDNSATSLLKVVLKVRYNLLSSLKKKYRFHFIMTVCVSLCHGNLLRTGHFNNTCTLRILYITYACFYTFQRTGVCKKVQVVKSMHVQFYNHCEIDCIFSCL